MDFVQEMKDKTESVNGLLERMLPSEEGFQKTVLEAMRYSVEAGGKRIRPVLMKATYDMFGGTSEIVLPFMAAMEMIHTYSLVHDDLPAMDNDMYRRGKLTTHAVYGEAMGILTGDALLNYAFETVGKAFEMCIENPDIDAKAVMKAYGILAKRAGVYGMIGGQVVDVATDADEELTREKLDFIYELKTGALLEASMEIGAVLAGADDKQLETITGVASKVGLAFQIQDDILDVTSTMEVLGKPIGSDEKNNKATYVTYEGLKKAGEDVKILSEAAIDELESLELDCSFLRELISYLIHRVN